MSIQIDRQARAAVALVGALMLIAPSAMAAFVEYKQNKAGWESAVGASFATLDFNFGQQVLVTDQYLSLGALFTDGNDYTIWDAGAFPNDGWGLRGGIAFAPGPIVVEFTQPMNWIAVEHPGDLFFELYSGDQLVYSSTWSGFPSADEYFMGIVSDMAFDKARIRDPIDNFVFIDDLYFGAPIPAPGGVAVLMTLLIRPTRRRRN